MYTRKNCFNLFSNILKYIFTLRNFFHSIIGSYENTASILTRFQSSGAPYPSLFPAAPSMLLRRAIALPLALALAAAAMWATRLALACATTAPAGPGPHVTTRQKKQPLIMGVGLGCHSSTSKSTPSSSSSAFRADATGAPMAASAGDLRSEFLQVLLSRRRDRQGQPPPSPPSLHRPTVKFAAWADQCLALNLFQCLCPWSTRARWRSRCTKATGALWHPARSGSYAFHLRDRDDCCCRVDSTVFVW
jgi:hypothetical protein